MHIQEFLIIKAFIYTWTWLDYEENSPSGARLEMVQNADRVRQMHWHHRSFSSRYTSANRICYTYQSSESY